MRAMRAFGKVGGALVAPSALPSEVPLRPEGSENARIERTHAKGTCDAPAPHATGAALTAGEASPPMLQDAAGLRLRLK